jgi:hypothetical protein
MLQNNVHVFVHPRPSKEKIGAMLENYFRAVHQAFAAAAGNHHAGVMLENYFRAVHQAFRAARRDARKLFSRGPSSL